MHTGHRERLRKKFNTLPSALEDHEILEALLFFSVPRANTNEVAHALIKRFSSLNGVLDADINQLQQVDGVGPSSALLIKEVSEIVRRYWVHQTEEKKSILRSHEALGEYLKSLFIGINVEVSYILLFDPSKNLIDTFTLSNGNNNSAIIPMHKIAQLVTNHNTAYVILAHNHPGGKAIPSGEDIAVTRVVKNFLAPLQIQLIDHFIVAGDHCVPILNSDKTHLYSPEE